MELTARSCEAIGDGESLDTDALQEAIDRCGEAGGGRVVLEPGTYLSGTLWLRSNVELHVAAGATLLGTTDPDLYEDCTAPGFKHGNAPEGNSRALLCASGADNIAITGAGEINGSGPSFYDTDIRSDQRHYAKPDVPRPRMVIFYDCRDVRLEGTAFVDSPCWTIWLVACERVHVHRIRVRGDQRMINNDGIDIDSCRDVTVSDSFFQTGDDCIVLRAIQYMLEEEAVCERVTVTNCVLDSWCQGIRIGVPSDNIIRHCVFSNLVIDGSGTGINIDNPRRYLHDDEGAMDLHDVMFSNISINSGRWPIRIYVEEGVRLRRLSGITFSDIRARGHRPLTVTGCEETILSDITFSNVTVETEAEEPIVCRHCRGIRMNNVDFTTVNA